MPPAPCDPHQLRQSLDLIRARVPRLGNRPAVARLLGDNRYITAGGLIRDFCRRHWSSSDAAACIARLRSTPVMPELAESAVPAVPERAVPGPTVQPSAPA